MIGRWRRAVVNMKEIQSRTAGIENKENTIVVGYDFGKESVQISFCRKNTEPESVAPVVGVEKFQIPAALCQLDSSGQWLYGDEAVKAAARGDYKLAGNLISNCRKLDPAEAESREESGQENSGENRKEDPVRLLGLFLKKTFSLVKTASGGAEIAAVMFTFESLDGDVIRIIRAATAELSVSETKIYIQDYKESFLSYVLNQPIEIWKQDVVLFECRDRKMMAYHLRMNQKTLPAAITITENYYDWPYGAEGENHGSMEERQIFPDDSGQGATPDTEFGKIIGLEFNKKVVSGVYLIGGCFDKTRLRKSMDYLCMGRRVFGGRNLYTKGACYAARDKFFETGRHQYLYLGEHMVSSNIAVEVKKGAERELFPLVEGGRHWYDAGASCEFILDDTREIRLRIIPLMGAEAATQVLALDNLPKRPPMTTRMRMDLSFSARREIDITVEDLGFGELFPGTGRKWRYKITLL